MLRSCLKGGLWKLSFVHINISSIEWAINHSCDVVFTSCIWIFIYFLWVNGTYQFASLLNWLVRRILESLNSWNKLPNKGPWVRSDFLFAYLSGGKGWTRWKRCSRRFTQFHFCPKENKTPLPKRRRKRTRQERTTDGYTGPVTEAAIAKRTLHEGFWGGLLHLRAFRACFLLNLRQSSFLCFL